MPSPERDPGGPSEQPRRNEHEPAPYHRTARFAGEREAGIAYFQAQTAIRLFREDCDLSAYRFLLDRVPHVAVLGESPPPDVDRRLDAILSAGEPATLPPEVLATLAERRRQAGWIGSWVEGHYRPGRRLDR